MALTITKLLFNLAVAVSDNEGQDLVEYALVVAIIALAATAGMSQLASSLNAAFSTLGTTLSNSI
jgi:pilus assembly protein Flp/PilA